MATTWQTRRLVETLRRQLDGILDAQVRDLVRAWAEAWDEVAPDLRLTLLEMLVAGDKVTRAQLLRSERLKAALAVIAGNLQRLGEQAGVRVIGDLQQIIDLAGGAQASVIDSQLPPSAPQLFEMDTWARVDARQIDAIVRRTTQQITALSKPLAPEAYQAVRRELIRGVASGSNPRDTALRIVRRAQGGFNGGLTRALVIARTESISAHREAAALAQAEHADVLAGWRWSASLDVRTCPACLSRHGELFGLEVPGPQGHQQCRCARVPELKSWADLGFSLDLDEPDEWPDARAWFESLPEVDQIRIMGRERLRMLRAGEISWEDLAMLRHTPGWRDSWVVTPLKDLRRKSAAA